MSYGFPREVLPGYPAGSSRAVYRRPEPQFTAADDRFARSSSPSPTMALATDR